MKTKVLLQNLRDSWASWRWLRRSLLISALPRLGSVLLGARVVIIHVYNRPNDRYTIVWLFYHKLLWLPPFRRPVFWRPPTGLTSITLPFPSWFMNHRPWVRSNRHGSERNDNRRWTGCGAVLYACVVAHFRWRTMIGCVRLTMRRWDRYGNRPRWWGRKWLHKHRGYRLRFNITVWFVRISLLVMWRMESIFHVNTFLLWSGLRPFTPISSEKWTFYLLHSNFDKRFVTRSEIA